MSTADFPADAAAELPRQKPRIALMGEFSAGKSTLSNIMIGHAAIPTRITATHLPPVWLSWGTEAPWRQDLSGNLHPVDPDRLEDVPVHETAFIRYHLEAEVLQVCDLIDTPGISDPNMAPEVWERAADLADGVLWLTHATQAWRQSEAAVWETMPAELRADSLLLVTRIDKLTNPQDRERVLARVRAETAGLFARVLPISLTEALAAGDDEARWAASGGEAFSAALLEIIGKVERRLRLTHGGRPARRGAAPAAMAPRPDAANLARLRHIAVTAPSDLPPSEALPAEASTAGESPGEEESRQARRERRRRRAEERRATAAE